MDGNGQATAVLLAIFLPWWLVEKQLVIWVRREG